MYKKLSISLSCLVILSGCMSVAEQALKTEENVIDIASNAEFTASGPGIYRLSKTPTGSYRLLRICPEDTNLQSAFKAIEPFGRKVSGKLVDQDAFDYVTISVNPLKTSQNIEGVLLEAGLTFNGIPRYKRVVEGYSVSGQKRAIAASDAVLAASFVEESVAPNCRSFLADAQGFSNRGKPVYVFEIAKADKIYTDLVNLPTLSGSAAKAGIRKGNVELKVGEGWRTDEAKNAVFGVRYFGVGPFKDREIPVTRF